MVHDPLKMNRTSSFSRRGPRQESHPDGAILGAGRNTSMNRRFQLGVVGLSTGLVALLIVGAVHGGGATGDAPYTHLQVYSEVLSRIQSQYVEAPDMKSVTLGGITGMLEAIDPYASYLNADQYKQYMASRNKNAASVG